MATAQLSTTTHVLRSALAIVAGFAMRGCFGRGESARPQRGAEGRLGGEGIGGSNAWRKGRETDCRVRRIKTSVF